MKDVANISPHCPPRTIVTGGAKGIGAGCARVFVAAGGRVAILDLDQSAGERLAAELTQSGPGSARFLRCDVSDEHAFRTAIDSVATDWDGLDCLINNAGIHPPATPLEDTAIPDVERLFQINFLSTFIGCKYAVPHLRRSRGTIVNISSMTAVLGQPMSGAYSASKAAQVGLTKALAVELGAAGIRVNAILPSNIDTPLMHEWAATLPDPVSALDRVAKLQVFGRMGTPEEIGQVAMFLGGAASSFITGQAIEAEGGSSLDY